MTDTVDLYKYREFVLEVTSSESKNLNDFQNRLKTLDDNNVNVPLLMTAAMGLGSEGGEFQEIVKKIVFQGKPLSPENIFHMKRELGDIIFYWINACTALNLNPNDVIQENIDKLSKRYPNGFSVEKSENREVGDI